MNRTTLLSLSLAILAAGYACAGEITVDPEPFVSVASRAQVRQELDQFRGSGVNPWADEYNQLAGFHSSTSRAATTAEYLAWRDAVAAFSSEDSGSSYIARANTRPSRRGSELASAE